MKVFSFIPVFLFCLFSVAPLFAQESFTASYDLKYAQVVGAEARQTADGSWSFTVTVRHNDQGWDHYADLWVVVDPGTGEVLAERVLAHPHEQEQPFTRSLGRVFLPEGLEYVEIRAKCNRHGFKGARLRLDLPG